MQLSRRQTIKSTLLYSYAKEHRSRAVKYEAALTPYGSSRCLAPNDMSAHAP